MVTYWSHIGSRPTPGDPLPCHALTATADMRLYPYTELEWVRVLSQEPSQIASDLRIP